MENLTPFRPSKSLSTPGLS